MIETLESGWSDCLPELAYLASMLSQMERQVKLTPGMVKPVLPAAVDWRLQMTFSQRRISLGGIDVITDGQGFLFLPRRSG